MRSWITASVLVAGSALGMGCSMLGGGESHADRGGRRAEVAGYRSEAGTGRLDWTSPATGQAVLLDENDNRVVLTQWVRAGDRITIEPGRDQVLLNGQSIYNKNLVHDHSHVVQFQPDGGGVGRWEAGGAAIDARSAVLR